MPEKDDQDAQWCLDAVQSAETFERLIGLAAVFVLDGGLPYKNSPRFAETRKAFAEKIRGFNIPDGDLRLNAVRDPVRAIDHYTDANWIGDWVPSVTPPAYEPRPDANPLPQRATVSAVKAGSGASPNLLFRLQ